MSNEIIKKDDNQYFNKFNPLISAKYNLDLIEQQMLDLSLANVTDDLSAVLTFSYIKDSLNRSDKMRAQLKAHCDKLRTTSIIVEDSANDRFAILNLYTTALYHNGKVQLKFNPDLRNFILNRKKNYTNLDVKIIASFTKVIPLRLYELLISKMYDEKTNIRDMDKTYELCFDYEELFLTIGIAEISPEVQSILEKLNRKSNNYKEIYRKAYAVANKKYEQMGLIKQRILNPAVEEINSISEINIVMQDIAVGKAHKIEGFKFFCTYKQKEKDKTLDVVDPTERNAFMDLLMQTYVGKLSFADMEAVANAANYNVTKLKQAIEIEQSKENIDNLTGFLIQAIKEGYKKKANNKKVVKKNKFNDFDMNSTYSGLSEEELEIIAGIDDEFDKKEHVQLTLLDDIYVEDEYIDEEES